MAAKKEPTPTPEPTPEPTPTPKADPPKDDPPAKTYTQAEYDAAMKKAQKDADKKIADAEAKAKLSEDERKDAELAEARKQLAERDQRDAIIEAASNKDSGIKNPKLFYNAYKNELEFDDKGKLKNFDDVLNSAKSESPELFGISETPKPQGGADGGEGKTNPGSLTKESIQAMSEKEIAANMDAIDAFLATQN